VHLDGVGLALSTAGATPFVDPVWVFLERAHFAAKTLGFGGCKSLDFLGFSRPNLDLSMGYRRFSVKDFSTALLSSRKRRGNGDPTIRHAEGMDCSWDKLSLISDFLQDIATTLPFGPPPSKSKSH
jgi:hypothetical protein